MNFSEPCVYYLQRPAPKIMTIDQQDLIPLLLEVLSLPRAHQRVWIFLLREMPVVRLYSPDVADVALRLGMTPRTVQRALASIRRTTILSRTVKTTRVNPQEHFIHEHQQEDHLSTDPR